MQFEHSEATPRDREAWGVTALRWILHHWPIASGRGRGLVWRPVRPLLEGRPVVMAVEPDIHVTMDWRDYMLRHHFMNGFERDPGFKLARQIVQPGDTVMDVGANLGLWVMGVAKKAGPQAAVHAFEPFPANFQRLRANLDRNGLEWVHCHPFALADQDGQASFLSPAREHSGRGHLGGGAQGTAISVPVRRLDSFCSEEGLEKVDLLKIDVEGTEIQVLRGAERLLARGDPPVVMFEVGDWLAAETGFSTAITKQYLAQLGYSILRYRHERLQLVAFDESHPISEDLFAFHPEHRRRYPWLRWDTPSAK